MERSILKLIFCAFLLFAISCSSDEPDRPGYVMGPHKQWYEANTSFTDAELNELLMSKAWREGSYHFFNYNWSDIISHGGDVDAVWVLHAIFIDGKYYVEAGPSIEEARNYVHKTLETLGEDYLDKYTIKDGVLYLEMDGRIRKKTVLAINKDYIFFDSDFGESGIIKEYWGVLPNH